MSTTIYNGIKLTKMNIQGLKHLAYRIREKVEPIQLELYHKALADICTDIIDNRILTDWCNYTECEIQRYGKAAEMKSPIHIAYFSIRERQRQIKLTQERDTEVDFDFNIAILPIRGKILAIPYTEQPEFLKVLMSLREVSAYGYWNNSDRPDGITAKQWGQRRKDWDEALLHSGIPSKNGFTIEILDSYAPMGYAEYILKYVRPLEERIKRHARKAVIDTHFTNIKRGFKSDMENFSAFDAFEKSVEFLGTPEGKYKQQQFIGIYRSVMQEITIADLFMQNNRTNELTEQRN